MRSNVFLENPKTTSVIVTILFIAGTLFYIYFFDRDFFQNDKRQIYFFSSKNCSFCKSFQPVWDQFVFNHQNNDVNRVSFHQIDGDKYPELARRYNVTHFPSIIALYNDKHISTFNSERTYNNLVKFLYLLQTSYI